MSWQTDLLLVLLLLLLLLLLLYTFGNFCDLPTAPRFGCPKLLYQPSKRGTSQVTSPRESVQHTSGLNSGPYCPFLNELSDSAAYSHSLTQSTKPTAAQILQTHLRKSIDARDASRLSVRQRKVTSEETR